MTTKRRKHRRTALAIRVLMGGEREYAFAVLDANGNRLEPAGYIDRLMREVRKLVACLPCGGDLDVFTANGSRVYVDMGCHPEVATPECTTPEEVVRYIRAGDRLLQRAAQAVESALSSEGTRLVLWMNNVDYCTGNSWAAHESYLHTVPQALLAEQLMTHLVTRTIFTGAGGFDNRAPSLRFVVCPRAFHLEHVISGNSTEARGIFHTRDEPLAAAPNRRLHVLAGESLWSETADYLRFATTALLLAQVEAGRRPQAGLDLTAPLEALRTIAADVSATAAVALRSSGHCTAIEVQRRLLRSVQADLEAGHLPSWAPEACRKWEWVLDRLESSPDTLVGILDWPTRLAVLRSQCETDGQPWTFTNTDQTHVHESQP